uniref:BAR domain-containing protein n=1 Tax=Astyanax mexicanus TaxID=7994 RepID=A0A8B9GWT5_ASTMX
IANKVISEGINIHTFCNGVFIMIRVILKQPEPLKTNLSAFLSVHHLAASRAKLSMLNTMSKIRGQVKSTGYPQAEGVLGECMVRYGREMGEDTNFGGALVEMGESMKRLAEVKDSLDIDVKQNFIDPFQTIVDKDLRDIQSVKEVDERFQKQKSVAKNKNNFTVQTVIDLIASTVLMVLCDNKVFKFVLSTVFKCFGLRLNNAQSQPQRKRMPKPVPSFDYDPEPSNGSYSPTNAPPSYSSSGLCTDTIRITYRDYNSKYHDLYCKKIYCFFRNIMHTGL